MARLLSRLPIFLSREPETFLRAVRNKSLDCSRRVRVSSLSYEDTDKVSARAPEYLTFAPERSPLCRQQRDVPTRFFLQRKISPHRGEGRRVERVRDSRIYILDSVNPRSGTEISTLQLRFLVFDSSLERTRTRINNSITFDRIYIRKSPRSCSLLQIRDYRDLKFQG